MIFCVEDDKSIRELTVYTLAASGFEALGLEDGAALDAALRDCRPELILLDVMLPGEDGISILKRLRASERFRELPVIMATAKGTEYDKVLGLDSGADDYLAKPFGMMELLSRVRAVLRRSSSRERESLRVGSLSLDSRAHRVLAGERLTELTMKEFRLLEKLMENPGRVLSREQLLSSVWGMEYLGESRTVDVHIASLRCKLGDCGEYIKTVRGLGYRLEKP